MPLGNVTKAKWRFPVFYSFRLPKSHHYKGVVVTIVTSHICAWGGGVQGGRGHLPTSTPTDLTIGATSPFYLGKCNKNVLRSSCTFGNGRIKLLTKNCVKSQARLLEHICISCFQKYTNYLVLLKKPEEPDCVVSSIFLGVQHVINWLGAHCVNNYSRLLCWWSKVMQQTQIRPIVSWSNFNAVQYWYFRIPAKIVCQLYKPRSILNWCRCVRAPLFPLPLFMLHLLYVIFILIFFNQMLLVLEWLMMDIKYPTHTHLSVHQFTRNLTIMIDL
jgi:hypothetical protein